MTDGELLRQQLALYLLSRHLMQSLKVKVQHLLQHLLQWQLLKCATIAPATISPMIFTQPTFDTRYEGKAS